MRIVGGGFLARNLQDAFGDRYPRVTAFAAGVSSTSVSAAEEFDREADLLYQVLRECRREGRALLFFSTASFAMYGAPPVPARESDPLFPPSVYGRHKLALESSVRSAGVEYLVLRLSHLVGRHQRPHQMLPGITRQVLAGEVTIQQGAHRDLLDVQDLLHVIGSLLDQGVSDEVCNVVSGRLEPIERIVGRIERRLGTTARRRVVVPRPGAALSTPVSTERLERWLPEFAEERIGGDYLERLLDRYLPYCVDEMERESDGVAG